MSQRHPICEGLHALESLLRREKARGRISLPLLSQTRNHLESLPASLLQRAKEGKERKKHPGEAVVSPAPPSPAAEKGDEKQARAQLNAIFQEAKSCAVCRGLGTLRETIVFASGNPLADLMFVGEAPGAEEEKVRRPFVGPAGQKLTQILQAMGFSRDDVYISNIVKFRPKKGDGRFQANSNRKPDATEMAASIRFIRAEIGVVSPRVIVALGATAAEGLLERGGTIADLRKEIHEFEGVPVVVTYHPSFLLRQESESDPVKAKAMKRRVWEDMLKAMEILGCPVSEKQRNYFL